jgi:hypothetical protein
MAWLKMLGLLVINKLRLIFLNLKKKHTSLSVKTEVIKLEKNSHTPEEKMGRPKKQVDSELKTNTADAVETETVMEQTKQTSVLDGLALGISKTKDGWAVVQIAYNAESGESDLQDVHLAGISRDDAIELFKITAVEKGLV